MEYKLHYYSHPNIEVVYADGWIIEDEIIKFQNIISKQKVKTVAIAHLKQVWIEVKD